MKIFSTAHASGLAVALIASLVLASNGGALTTKNDTPAGRKCLKACHNSGKTPKKMIECEVRCCKTHQILWPPSKCDVEMRNPALPEASQGGGILEQ